MIRKLLIVFASGLVLAIVSLSSAWVIGGQELMARTGETGRFVFNGHHREDRGPKATKTLVFDGTQMLSIDIPVSLRFTRGEQSQMVVSGPAGVVNALKWENGALSLSDKAMHYRDLTVTITAPQIAGLELNAPGDIELDGLDQPSLKLSVNSPASVEARGRVGTVEIDASGVGDVDFEKVEARDAKLSLSGVGGIDVSASGKVDAVVSGAGSVTLHRKPEVLNSRTSGLGSIDEDFD